MLDQYYYPNLLPEQLDQFSGQGKVMQNIQLPIWVKNSYLQITNPILQILAHELNHYTILFYTNGTWKVSQKNLGIQASM